MHMPLATGDSITVVLVTFNSRPALDECLVSLKPELASTGAELVAVDNGSTDGSLEHVESVIPAAVALRNRRNRGFAAACNQGAAAARGTWLVFLNPDVCVDPGALEALVQALARHPEAGLAAARLRSPDGAFQPSCRQFPTPTNLQYSRGSVLGRKPGSGEPYTMPDCRDLSRVPAVAAAFVMIQRKRFQAMNGFDERFFVFMEDTDLSLRLEHAGHSNLFVPAAGATHAWGHGSSTGRLRRAALHHVSMWKYFRKHHPGAFSLLLLPLLLGANLALTALLSTARRSRAARARVAVPVDFRLR
jgi:GT2 family glycosyltransferase